MNIPNSYMWMWNIGTTQIRYKNSEIIWDEISLFLVSLCQVWGAARNFFTASSDSVFHPPLYLVFFFQSSSSPAFLTSLLTQSSHLSLGLPRLLLPCSRNSAALFGSLSPAILSTCPVHCNLLLTSLSVKLICTPVSSLNSTILRLSALVSLAIFRAKLFLHTCSLCCCSSVSVKVSVPYRNVQECCKKYTCSSHQLLSNKWTSSNH